MAKGTVKTALFEAIIYFYVFKKANDGVAYFELSFNQKNMGYYGVQQDDLNEFLNTMITGTKVGIIQEGMRRVDLVVKGDVSYRNSLNKIAKLYYPLANGKSVALSRLINFMVIVPIALFLVFMMLFVSFGSLSQTIIVFMNVPLALIGGFAGLYFSGEYMSVPASVGFIALLGIAMLNGVVMVNYFNYLIAKGVEIKEVVVEGAIKRLRPVLMTALIASFGLVPLLFATGPGSEIQRPLAIVVINGLASSTLLTLILLPVLYGWVFRKN